jgi:hypothetical protein
MSKRPLAVIAIVLAVAAAVLLATQSKHSTAQAAESPPPIAPTTAQLVNTAISAAALTYGESAPTDIQEATAGFATAAHVLDPTGSLPTVVDPETGKQWSESKVDVVSMQGHFTYKGPTPLGQPAPKGTVLTVVVEVATGAVINESLRNVVPDMSAVNPSVTQWEAQ